ncbi:hypothetical protein AB0J82_15395 [Asanoa sp. NPDC049518]|uniref:hypothetical protein n=1 Tax=unclassified Asanoa TaxID=2685164 RepID=UPI003434ABAC
MSAVSAAVEYRMLPAASPFVTMVIRSNSRARKWRPIVDNNPGGDNIRVGDITGSYGVAVGRNASAHASGNIVAGARVDPEQLRVALERVYDTLDTAGLPREETRSAQTSAGNAIEAAKAGESGLEAVVENVKRMGQTLREANVVVGEGSNLWQQLKELAAVLAPLAGGAAAVAAWFGFPLQ